ncbi:hypothetical protein AMTRI_Chr09g39200 [Amborella trichopoda]
MYKMVALKTRIRALELTIATFYRHTTTARITHQNSAWFHLMGIFQPPIIFLLDFPIFTTFMRLNCNSCLDMLPTLKHSKNTTSIFTATRIIKNPSISLLLYFPNYGGP